MMPRFILKEYSPDRGTDVVLIDKLRAREMIGNPSDAGDDDGEKL